MAKNNSSVAFPTLLKFENMTVFADRYEKSRDFEQLFSLMKGASDEGIGIDSKEYTSSERVEKVLDKSITYVWKEESPTGNLMAASLIMPCVLSRSERPVYNGSNLVVHEKYRSRGIGRFVLVSMQKMNLGHNPVLGRHTIIARSMLPARFVGATYLGIIPKSIRLRKPEVVVDDVIVYYGHHMPTYTDKRQQNVSTITSRSNLTQISAPTDTRACDVLSSHELYTVRRCHINNFIHLCFLQLQLAALNESSDLSILNQQLPLEPVSQQIALPSDEILLVKEVPRDDYLPVEKIIRRAASSGRVFGIDEFTEKGLWNRKFLRRTYVLGLYNVVNDLQGVVLFGPSSICRTDSVLVSGYIALEPDCRHKGIETQLMRLVEKLTQQLNFEGVLMDVFRTEFEFMSLLMDMGYTVTGSLPKCGFVKGKGHTDSLLLYKEFVIGSSKL